MLRRPHTAIVVSHAWDAHRQTDRPPDTTKRKRLHYSGRPCSLALTRRFAFSPECNRRRHATEVIG